MTESGSPGDPVAPAGGTGTPGSGWSAAPPPAPVPGAAGFVYADVPNRVIAYIIDAIIIGIINILITIVLAAIGLNPFTVSITGSSINFIGLILYAIIAFALSAAYFIYTWTRMRATVGMRALGMQIGNAGDGKTMTTEQGGRRWFALFAPFVLAQIASGIGFIGLIFSLAALGWVIYLLYTMAQSPTKQGFQDIFANTMVVKAARTAG
jgi:uncharacterized RDD family membrane protein YckC